MRRIALIVLTLLLVACVDTTGLSPNSTKGVHPNTSENAAVQVVEYGDFECPACKSINELVAEPLIAKYGKQIGFTFKQFPLQAQHRYAYITAQASECAADQGKFWEFLNYDYAHQEELPNRPYEEWAKALGLDWDLFDRCIRSGIKEDAIDADYDAGVALGVDATPTFFVNGVRIEIVDATTLDMAVQKALDSAGAKL